MVRVAVIAGLFLTIAGCGGGSSDRGQQPRPRPTRTAAERVLTASDVDVLPSRGGTGFPGGTLGCEAQVRRMLMRQARHAATPAQRHGARLMLREFERGGDFSSGCSSITIPLTRSVRRRGSSRHRITKAQRADPLATLPSDTPAMAACKAQMRHAIRLQEESHQRGYYTAGCRISNPAG